MKRCYFCESSKTSISRIKIIGRDLGKRKQLTVNICLTCSAMTDDEWIREFLDWSKVSKVINVTNKQTT